MKKTEQRKLRKVQIFWSIFIGLGAFLGAAMMFISPSGEMFGMEPLLPLLRKLPFPEIFFRNFIWPAVALLLVNGISNTLAFIMLVRKNKYGSLAGMTCGVLLMLWITVQFVIFQFNFMSTAYFVFGVLQTFNGYLLYRSEKKDGYYKNQ